MGTGASSYPTHPKRRDGWGTVVFFLKEAKSNRRSFDSSAAADSLRMTLNSR